MDISFKEDIQPLIKPVLIALGAFVIGYFIFNLKQDEEDSSGKIVTMIIGGIFFAGGAGFIIWPLGRLMVSAFEAIFWPQDNYKAPANYKLPEWYCQQGRYAEALEEYEKIVQNYPRELDGWIGLLNVAIYYMGDAGHGEKIYLRAKKALTEAVDQQAVEEHYAAIRTGLGSARPVEMMSPEEDDPEAMPSDDQGEYPDGDRDLPER